MKNNQIFRGSPADGIMSVVFMVLAIAAGICYFSVDDRRVFFVLAGVAVIFRIIQYAIRFFR